MASLNLIYNLPKSKIIDLKDPKYNTMSFEKARFKISDIPSNKKNT